MATQVQASIAITDGDFLTGYQHGVDWALHGDLNALNDEIIVQYVRDNVLGEAFDVPMDDESMKRHIAFLVGWIVEAVK
jgi:hypothetical protein